MQSPFTILHIRGYILEFRADNHKEESQAFLGNLCRALLEIENFQHPTELMVDEQILVSFKPRLMFTFEDKARGINLKIDSFEVAAWREEVERYIN